MKKVLQIFGALVIAVLLLEAAIRVTGIVDFPIYEVNPKIGYIPAQNQSGSFLNKNRWSINEKHQCSPHWNPNQNPDILLIGDSVVWGGNPLNDPAKLGYCLQSILTDFSIWSASAGSWGILNTLAYLDLHSEIWPDLEHIVWVLNSGDYGEKSHWETDLTHPRSKPWSANSLCFTKVYTAKAINKRRSAR